MNILDEHRNRLERFCLPFWEMSESNFDDGKSASVKIPNPFGNVLSQLAADLADMSPDGDSGDRRRHGELVAKIREVNENFIADRNGKRHTRESWIPVGHNEFHLFSLQLTTERFFIFEIARSRYDAYFFDQKAPYDFDELMQLVCWLDEQSNDFCKSVVAFFYSNAFITPKQFQAANKLKNPEEKPNKSNSDSYDDYYSGPSDLEVLREMAEDFGWTSTDHFLDSLGD